MRIRNPSFTEKNDIDCEIEHEVFGWIPFTATSTDVEPRGREIYAALLSGVAGEISPYAPPAPPSDEQKAEMVRETRDALLAASDWTQLPDVPESTRELWAEYRQALRDVPSQPGFPWDVTWPATPA